MMSKHASSPCIAVFVMSLLLFLPAIVEAGVISPQNCTVPAALSPCPAGDRTLTFVTRDLANNPVPNVFVVLDFSLCPGAYVCPSEPSDHYLWNPTTRQISQSSDATGTVTFSLRVGGVGAVGSVKAYGNAILMASYALASPDQDGDGAVGSVTGSDATLFAGKLGSSDPTADFDGDGDVDATDEQFFIAHHDHLCSGIVSPTVRRTWSRVKQLYR